MFVEVKSRKSAINLDHVLTIGIENIDGGWKLKARYVKNGVEIPVIIFEYKNDESGQKAAEADYTRLLQALADNKSFWSPFE